MYLKLNKVKNLKNQENQNKKSVLKIKLNNLFKLFKKKVLNISKNKRNFQKKCLLFQKILTKSILKTSLINVTSLPNISKLLIFLKKKAVYSNLKLYYYYYLIKFQRSFELCIEQSIFKFLEKNKFKNCRIDTYTSEKNSEKKSNIYFLNLFFKNQKFFPGFYSFSLFQKLCFIFNKRKFFFWSGHKILKNKKITDFQKFSVNEIPQFFSFYLLTLNSHFLKFKKNSLISNLSNSLNRPLRNKTWQLNIVFRTFYLVVSEILNVKKGNTIFMYFLKKLINDLTLDLKFEKLNSDNEIMFVNNITYRFFDYPLSNKFTQKNNFEKLSNQFKFFNFLTTIHFNETNIEFKNQFSKNFLNLILTKHFFELLNKKCLKNFYLTMTNLSGFDLKTNMNLLKYDLFLNSFYFYLETFFIYFTHTSFFDLFKKISSYNLMHRTFLLKNFEENFSFHKISFLKNKKITFKHFFVDVFSHFNIKSWLLILKQTYKSQIFFNKFLNFFQHFSKKNLIKLEIINWEFSPILNGKKNLCSNFAKSKKETFSTIDKLTKNKLSSIIPISKKNFTFFLFSNANSLSCLNEFELKKYLLKLKKCIKKNSSQSQDILIKFLSEKLYSWCYYYSRIQLIFKNVYFCDNRLYTLLWKWACRRHSNKSKYWIQHKYFYKFNNQIWLFGNVNLNSTKLMYLPFHTEILMHLHKSQKF